MNKDANHIAIIIPYFGQWPEWIDVYFYSCRNNNHIDWIFFTDCLIPQTKSSNLFFYPIDFEEYCKNTSNKLNIHFSPQCAYKLCDLRPFYGIVHADILKAYDFWGFGDLDIIWGNLKKFYPDDLLSKYDVFSTHNDRVSGHLTIIRNIQKYNHLCLQIKDWQAKLCSEINEQLDEAAFSQLLFPESRIIGKIYRQVLMKHLGWRRARNIYCSIFPLIHSLLRTRKRKLFFKEQYTTPILSGDGHISKNDSENWLYKDNKIYNLRTGREHIYLHFMLYKKNNVRPGSYYWNEDFYSLDSTFDYSKGVIVDTKGISPNANK
ncbi:DUF6625 family protein [Paludibacter jiangxiensis]|uniref:Uncharacterized protein n=1 Tax=Paludibacter jiangxiensis TaxID=681398 RepID=A0A170ZP38_9BACT|nr:DUF6625 family protein [Paludibacter jiangxiensis]GAT62876.1 hypothetical protein PJIAN_3187 [Paludibacter jiangxiensis]